MVQQVHPCTRFQNGEIKDFETAMRTYVEQQEFEAKQAQRYENSAQEESSMWESVVQARAVTTTAMNIYEEIVSPAIKEAARQMRATNDPILSDFAKALERNDYCGLSL